MGYASQVVISLHGKTEDVALALSMYQASETTEQIDASWHILSTADSYVDFFYAYDKDKMYVAWRFNWVKFYEESQEAVSRLGKIVDILHEEHDAEVTLTTKRIGEDVTDYEQLEWGEGEYDGMVEVVRELRVDWPKADIKQFFENKTAWGGKIQGEDNASK